MSDSGVPTPPAPSLAPPALAGSSGAVPPGLTGWMSFVGIMTILAGVLNILSCVGIPSGVLMLIGGIALMGAKTSLEAVREVNPTLLPFFLKLKTFMVTTGWVYILTLILLALGLLFWGGVMMTALLGAVANGGN